MCHDRSILRFLQCSPNCSYFIKKISDRPENRPRWYNMVQSIKGDYPVYARPSFQPKCFARIGDRASIVAAKTKLIPSCQQFFSLEKQKPRLANSTFCFVCPVVCGGRNRLPYLVLWPKRSRTVTACSLQSRQRFL